MKVGKRIIGPDHPVYFIADIGANHDGNLTRAKDLIRLAKDAGADCAKFQHFQASKIVSAVGFDGFRTAHQRGWDKSVFEVYQDCSINPDWNEELANTCGEVGIDFMSTPYDKKSATDLRKWVPAYKIGSGDITYLELIKHIASMKLPTFMATGASDMGEVETAVATFLRYNSLLCLMQCNTNYTGSGENFRYVNLAVLRSFARRFPDMPLGLSDHTPGHATAVGAVALGACVVEKHFTDDNSRRGPDHAFAMTPNEWSKMRANVMLVERAMGDGQKVCEANEVESRVVQRRAIRLKTARAKGSKVHRTDFEYLRPCPDGAYTPADVDEIVGKVFCRDMPEGREIYPDDISAVPGS